MGVDCNREALIERQVVGFCIEIMKNTHNTKIDDTVLARTLNQPLGSAGSAVYFSSPALISCQLTADLPQTPHCCCLLIPVQWAKDRGSICARRVGFFL